MSAVRNPFVDYLRRYTTASPDHEAAFDEFLAQIAPPTGAPLRLETRVEKFLRAIFQHADPPSVILTGNAGDGKTYLCRQIIMAFTGQAVDDWEVFVDQPLERDGQRLHIIKDLSELGTERGMAILQGLATTLINPSSDRYLIAANEGRLRDLLSRDATLQPLYRAVDRQLHDGPDIGSAQLIVINLTAVTTSSFVPAALQWMTQSEHWADCQACPIHDRCPVQYNAHCLRDASIAGRVQLLYQLLEHLDTHVTVRDMLIHLAYTLTGDLHCAEIQRMDQKHQDLSSFAYYANIWGGAEGSAFRRKATVVQHLSRLRIGDHSLFEIDDFIVNGGENAERMAAHRQIFAPAVDLNHRRFGQDRMAYVEGGADQQADDEAAALMRWLPHCRRKLFFAWREPALVNQLIPFLHLGTYLSLLRDERGLLEHVRRDLVLGLNRAFSHLYLTDASNLYVTTQYIHSAEQPRPLVRLTIPIKGIELRVDRCLDAAFDREHPDLLLTIGAPPTLTLQGSGIVPKPENWRLNLLLFEYLMRLAHGGTYNILAEECELSVRGLKDRLLSAFAREPAPSGVIEFFVADRRRYTLQQLVIDEQGHIRSGGGGV